LPDPESALSAFYPVVPSVELAGVAFGRVGAGLLAVRAEDLAAGPVRTAGRRGGGQAPARDRQTTCRWERRRLSSTG